MSMDESLKRGLQWDRRVFLSTSAALAAYAAGWASADTQQLNDPLARVIDVHCHVFNAKDVPAAEFIMKVAAREQGLGIFASLAALGAEILRLAAAPSAQAEIAHLEGPAVNALTEIDEDAQFRNNVYDALVSLAKRAKGAKKPNFQTSEFQSSEIDLAAEENRINGLIPNDSAAALRAIENTYNISGAIGIGPAFSVNGVRTNNAVPLGNPVLPERESSLNQMADAIASDERAARNGTPQTAAGRYFMVIRVFTSYRAANVRTLDKAYGFALPARTRLYCPATVDYDPWLGADSFDRSTNLRDQVHAMAVVARKADQNVLVAGYIAFDPLRAAIDEHLGVRDFQTTLGVVREAIESSGFIGAKIYPPMGFRAWENAQSGEAYGPNVAALLRKKGMPADYPLGEAFDRALDALYRYCLKNDVPILAHCGDSQTSFSGSGTRASPVYWKQLLDRGTVDGLDFSKLRLNLGHFGGIWCRTEDPKPGSDEARRCTDQSIWPKTIVDMVGAGSPGAWTYPNLSFDLADIGAVGDQERRARLIVFLESLLTGHDRSRVLSRMMYGTDWMFLGLDSGYGGFARGMTKFSDALRVNIRDLMWRNAATYLGLTEGAASAMRLQNFYRVDSERLAALHNVLV